MHPILLGTVIFVQEQVESVVRETNNVHTNSVMTSRQICNNSIIHIMNTSFSITMSIVYF